MVNRLFNFPKNNSFLLFGARGTGKSTYLNTAFKAIKHHYIDLLNPDEEEKYSKNPNTLLHFLEENHAQIPWIIIDEIQKVPKLLNIVHLAIEKYQTLFALTGSSARKLKRGSANLLAGRAFVFNLYPFTFLELGQAFDLNHVLNWGSLPKLSHLHDDADKIRYLKSYTQTYLKEEIVAEQVIRKLDPFRQFLEIAAQQNSEINNYTNIARDVGVDTVTVQNYFQILEDTLVGYQLPSFHQSIRKRQRVSPKFYYFDLGVKRMLDGTIHQALSENTYAYGKAFEHFVITEIVRLNAYYEKDYRLSYLRTKDDAEIDLIVERPGMPTVIIEIKSTRQANEHDIRNLKKFKPDMGKNVEAFCLSRDPVPKMVDGIHLLPWDQGIKNLF